MRVVRVQIRPHEQRTLALPLPFPLTQDVHHDRRLHSGGVWHIRRRRFRGQKQDLRVRHHPIALNPADPTNRRGGARFGGRRDDVREARAAPRQVSALEQRSAASKRTAQLARRAHHVADRRYARAVLGFRVVEEQRGLVQVRREHRRERNELVYERAECVVLNKRVPGRRHAHRVDD